MKRGMLGVIVIILILLFAIYRVVSSLSQAQVRDNLQEGRLYTSCSTCDAGIPLFDDIRPSRVTVATVPSGEACDVQAWYESYTMRPTLQAQYGGEFVEGAFYLVDCPSGDGWIEAQFTSR